MKKISDFILEYPPNLGELDLATMVSMYRSRGEPRKAAPGQYVACNVTGRLQKEAKWWFGLYYSQKVWDSLLTKSSGGYPMTETELQILGHVLVSNDKPVHREEIENNLNSLPKLNYLIINDLKHFGFLNEDEQGMLQVTSKGKQVLDGIAKRLYGKRFMPPMLDGFEEEEIRSKPKKENDQPSLF